MNVEEIKEYLEKVKPSTGDNWIPLQPWWGYLQFLLKRIEELELKLNSWVCAYCGQEFPKDALMAPLAVANHTLTCDKNPMVEELRQTKSRLNELEETLYSVK